MWPLLLFARPLSEIITQYKDRNTAIIAATKPVHTASGKSGNTIDGWSYSSQDEGF